MNYKLYPGRQLNKVEYEQENFRPIISIITPFYNSKNYIEETVNSVLNQTYPYYEWIIVDDGSTDKESIELLNKIEKMDDRIKIYHNQNQGLAYTRDYGVSKSSDSSKYLFFLDDDDLINSTYLECAYWTLETNKGASWAYTDTVNFYNSEYEWSKWFDSDIEKKENLLVATALVRKEAFMKVKGYAILEKAVFEDWNFWLKLLAEKMYPVRMNFLGFWYRKKSTNESELARGNSNQERAKKYAKETAKRITEKVEAIQYPKQDYNWDGIDESIVDTICMPKLKKNNKINILMIIPWMVTGGADKFNLDLITRLDKSKFNITIVSTLPNINNWRQLFEEHATVYDLTTFLDRKYWVSFIRYLIEVNSINLIFNTNSTFGYSVLPYLKCEYPSIPVLDYIHMEEWYNRNGGFSRDTAAIKSIIDKTLVCNKNSERILVEHFKKSPKDVETVYIGVDEKKFDSNLYNKESILTKYNINPDKKFIISFIGRIDFQKRPHLLMEIICMLKERRKDFLFVIAGDGPLLNEIKDIARRRKLVDDIVFLGGISNPAEIYKISDLTLNCSIKEGLALTSYESLAMGVPVISSNVGGQAELINSKVGIIVPCLQEEKDVYVLKYEKGEITNYVLAIDKVLDNLKSYKSNARNTILNGFTIDNMVEHMTKIFNEMVQEQKDTEIFKGLKPFRDVTLELINNYLILSQGEYKYLCDNWNMKTFCIIPSKDNSIRIREILWRNPLWRLFIKTIKKIGIKR